MRFGSNPKINLIKNTSSRIFINYVKTIQNSLCSTELGLSPNSDLLGLNIHMLLLLRSDQVRPLLDRVIRINLKKMCIYFLLLLLVSHSEMFYLFYTISKPSLVID